MATSSCRSCSPSGRWAFPPTVALSATTRRPGRGRGSCSTSGLMASSCRTRCSHRPQSLQQQASSESPMEEIKTNGASAGHARLDPELLIDVGHQRRNQLNAIVGAAGLLSATATSSDQRELASVVLTGAEELAGLVDEGLYSPAIHSGDFEVALHPFNLRASVQACLAPVPRSRAGEGEY